MNISCQHSANTQKFIVVPKLHVLGANIGSNVFNTVNTVEREINAIKHGIFSNIVLHSGFDPKYDPFDAQTSDNFAHYTPGTTDFSEWISNNYIQDMSYVDVNKSTVYNEYSYLTQMVAAQGSSSAPNAFYSIPDDNILSFGVIRNKLTNQWEWCLIDEGNEKCNLTLESRLITYFTGGTVDFSHITQEDSDLRLYNHALLGETVTVLPGKQVLDFPTYGICPPVSSADFDYSWDNHSLTDLNMSYAHAQYYNNTVYNFFLGGTKVLPSGASTPIYEYPSDGFNYEYSPENVNHSIFDFPGEHSYFWGTTPPSGVSKARNSGGNGSGTNYFRYYIPSMDYCVGSSVLTYTPNLPNHYHENNFRYTGSVLSNPNAYSSMLGHTREGKVVRLPEIRTDFNNSNSIAYCSDAPHSMTKQTNRYTSLYEGSPSLKNRPPLKSGISKNFFEDYAPSTTNEGYLSDRDVILVNKGIGPEYGLTQNHYGITNGTTRGLNISSIPREIEFELFYCANINNPFACQNLFNFGRKLNAFTSGFNTGILKESVQNKVVYNYNNPNENDFVHIQQLKDYSNSSLVYGCEWEIQNTPANVSTIESIINGSSAWAWHTTQPKCTKVIPTVDITGVWIWENCGVPKFGSKKLIGTKNNITEHYSYGEYFLAYFAHNLYLIDSQTFNTYFYTAQEFKELVDDMIDPNDTGNAYNYNKTTNVTTYSTCLDPFTTTTSDLPMGTKRSSYSKLGA